MCIERRARYLCWGRSPMHRTQRMQGYETFIDNAAME